MGIKTTVVGDILTVESGIIVHGCNSHGVMGGGIAWQVRRKWPEVYEFYREDYLKNGQYFTGYTQPVKVKDDLYVINAITQKDYGTNPNHVYVDYEAIRTCFKHVARFARDKGLPIHYPAIGAGLANGNWEIISKIIDEELAFSDHTFWLYEG